MPQCLICSGSDITVYLDQAGESPGENLDASQMGSSRTTLSPGKILRCKTCGFAFRQSRFSEKQLADLYRSMDTQVYQAELSGRIRTASRHLRILSRNARRNGSPGELLDVGCASGIFLAQALDAGWRVTGLEPSEVLFKEASERIGSRGTILPQILEEASLDEQRFDAVTLWDVLEHVADPINLMRKCCQLLKPGGLLLLNVPDLDSREARFLGRRWPLLLPEHLNYFNRASLTLCAQKSGLELVRFGRRHSYFSIEYVLYRLSQHRIPLSGLLSSFAQSAIGHILVPVSPGETYAVFRRNEP